MISFLQMPSNGTDKSHVRDAYRQRLQEIADSTSYSSTTSDWLPGAETGQPDSQFILKVKVEEMCSEPAVASDEGFQRTGFQVGAPSRPPQRGRQTGDSTSSPQSSRRA